MSDRLHPRQQALGPGHAGEVCYTGDGTEGDMTVWHTVEGTLRRMSPCTQSCTQSESELPNQNCRKLDTIKTAESWTINYENSKKRFVTCLASPHEQRGSEGRSAGIEAIATRMGWTMVKYHSSIFSPPVASSTDCFADAGAVRTSRNVPSQYQILLWCIIKLKMACTGAVQKIELVSTYFPQLLASL